MTTPIENLVAGVAKVIAEVFNRTGEIPPLWLGVDRDGNPIDAVTPWSDDETKTIMVAGIRELFRQRKIVVYVFACEAWTVATRTMDEANAVARNCETHPDRREVIHYTAEDIHGHQAHAVQYILRPEHGPAKLSPLKFTEGHLSGCLTGILAR